MRRSTEMNSPSIAPYITKGSRIRAQWFKATDACLAGAQAKIGASLVTVTGTCRHFRGNRPANPTEIRIYLDADGAWDGLLVRPPGCTCARAHVQINPDHIVEVGVR